MIRHEMITAVFLKGFLHVVAFVVLFGACDLSGDPVGGGCMAYRRKAM